MATVFRGQQAGNKTQVGKYIGKLSSHPGFYSGKSILAKLSICFNSDGAHTEFL